MLLERVARIAVAAGAVLVVGATPAAADPAEPTDYQSTIESIEPAVDGMDAEIVGGDSFIRLRVEPGHTVVVEGYQEEPYLQILDDGTVQENRRSEATYLNEDRYAGADVPTGLSPDDPPEWQTIDDDGEHAWHDHRIHWMSPDRPPGVEPGEIVQTQTVPLTFDGSPVAITVSVRLEHGTSPWPWAGMAVVAAAAVGALGWGRRSLLVAAGAAVACSALAVVTGRGEQAATPSGTGGSPLVVIVPIVAAVAAVAAVALLVRRQRAGAGIALLAAAAALAGWALLRLAVLSNTVLPTDLPFAFDRAATSLAIAGAVAVAALTIRSGAVTPAPLTDE